MTIIKLLEEIANNAHHRLAITNLIKDQPNDIRQAFATNNNAQIRRQFNDPTEIMANRSTIVQVTNN